MTKFQTKISFGNENLDSLINQIVKDKVYKVTNRLKNGDTMRYSQKGNNLSINIDKKVDKTKWE